MIHCTGSLVRPEYGALHDTTQRIRAAVWRYKGDRMVYVVGWQYFLSLPVVGNPGGRPGTFSEVRCRCHPRGRGSAGRVTFANLAGHAAAS